MIFYKYIRFPLHKTSAKRIKISYQYLFQMMYSVENIKVWIIYRQ